MPQVAHTLRTAGYDASEDGSDRGTPLVAEAFDGRQSHVLHYGEQAGPLDTDGHTNAVLMRTREGREGGGKGPLLSPGESLTLATGNDQILFTPQGIAENQRGEIETTDYAHAISAGGGKPGQGYPAILDPSDIVTGPGTVDVAIPGIRRLAPLECERLQGFDDGWTEPAGSDAARYRALGNAVTVTVPTWLFTRIRNVGV